MKICGKLLVLYVFHPNVWGTTAFLVQVPKALAFKSGQTRDALTPTFLSVRDAYKVAKITGSKEGHVLVKAASKIDSTPPVTTMDESGRKALKARLAGLEAASKINKTPLVATADENRRKALKARLAALEASGRLATLGKGQSSAVTQVSGPNANPVKKMLDTSSPVTVHGGSRTTWSFASPYVERVQVVLQTEGRPLDADIELWQGPDNTPQKMRVYVEDGSMRPFSAVIETPRSPNTIAIRNIGQMEFPVAAYVAAADNASPGPSDVTKSSDTSTPRTIQGGALRTYPFETSVESVQVLLKTDGGPLNARIELLQGPNNNKQVIEIYTEDGMNLPFFAVIETPGSGYVVRVVNTATVEFPLTAWVEPYVVGSDKSGSEAVLGGDTGGMMWDRQLRLERLR